MQWSLEKIYRERVRGNVPPRKHLNVLGEAKIRIKFDDPPEEVSFELPDYYAREVMGYTAGAKHHIDGLVRKWLEKAMWSEEGVSKALPQVKGALHNAFGKEMKDRDVVKGIANEIRLLIENKPQLIQFDEFVIRAADPTAGAEDLFDVFSEVAGSGGLGLKYLNNKDFLAGLFQINFSEGQVAVGPGEVAMTLYSSAYNPPKGDLKTTSVGEVEMKGKAGRVGKGTEAVAVDREIKKYSRDEHLDEERLRRLNIVRGKITDYNIVDLIKYIPEGTNARKALEGLSKIQKSKDLEVLKDKDVYDRIRTEAPQAANVEKIIGFLQAGDPDQKTIKYSRLQGEWPVFNGEVRPIQNALQDIMSDLYDINEINANGMTTRFNTFWRGDESRWEDMIFKYVPKEHRDKVRDDIQQHIGGMREAEAESARIAQEVAAATMISTYQAHEKFNYIMFANTNEKVIERGACPAVVIGPFSNNYKDNLKLCLEKINLLKISPNVERGSGFNIEVM